MTHVRSSSLPLAFRTTTSISSSPGTSTVDVAEPEAVEEDDEATAATDDEGLGSAGATAFVSTSLPSTSTWTADESG